MKSFSEWNNDISRVSPRLPMTMSSVLFLLGGLAVGLHLPDIDQFLPLLDHRSILTHSPFLSIAIFILALKKRHAGLLMAAVGISLGVAVHLAFDLFPRGWSGYALISAPIYGRTGALFSGLWIGGSMGVCLYLAMVHIPDRRMMIVSLSGSGVGFCHAAIAELVISIPALLALILSTWGIWRVRRAIRSRQTGSPPAGPGFTG